MFVTVTVKVTVSPSSGVPLSTVLPITRSVLLPTVIDSLGSSAVALLSAWSRVTFVTVLVIVLPEVPASTSATMVNVALAPLLSVPIVHVGCGPCSGARCYRTDRQAGGQGVIDADVGGLSRAAVCHRDGEGDRVAFIRGSVIYDLCDDQIGAVTDRDRFAGIIGSGVAVGLIQGDV